MPKCIECSKECTFLYPLCLMIDIYNIKALEMKTLGKWNLRRQGILRSRHLYQTDKNVTDLEICSSYFGLQKGATGALCLALF